MWLVNVTNKRNNKFELCELCVPVSVSVFSCFIGSRLGLMTPLTVAVYDFGTRYLFISSDCYREGCEGTWIFPGIHPKSDGIWNSSIFFWTIFRVFVVKISSLTQIRLTIHFAMPKNKQCIGSTVTNLTGSKYGKRNNSDHLTPVCFTNRLRDASELQRLQAWAFPRCLAGSRAMNHSSMSSIPVMLCCQFS